MYLDVRTAEGTVTREVTRFEITEDGIFADGENIVRFFSYEGTLFTIPSEKHAFLEDEVSSILVRS